MKILFTKKSDAQMISRKLGDHFSFDFVEVISTENISVKPFDLEDNSLIFTSVNGVKSFFENGFEIRENKIYCVGKTTEKSLAQKGFQVFRTEKNAVNLADFIAEHSADEKFIHFAGNISLDTFHNKFLPESVDYKKVILYTTHLIYPELSRKYDAIVFFSPSGVRSFAKFNSLEDVQLFSIGETTEKELKKFTQNTISTSKANHLDDLLDLIKSMQPEA
ncbi:uroporphyrinogen-III synthase [Chryseobacterium sp.]|uniref:uroporphyrinogen-III synthase n=1 Tax=Chryseobacterium sp. TaxID=1871047 RepID=UPI0011C7A16D|nr:uroporphyrinogen-III synthase [Chryseobacterium sp.]TXF76094.1 uroporphyrinogen-III synthase [Chryseobacterium sp.]